MATIFNIITELYSDHNSEGMYWVFKSISGEVNVKSDEVSDESVRTFTCWHCSRRRNKMRLRQHLLAEKSFKKRII